LILLIMEAGVLDYKQRTLLVKRGTKQKKLTLHLSPPPRSTPSPPTPRIQEEDDHDHIPSTNPSQYIETQLSPHNSSSDSISSSSTSSSSTSSSSTQSLPDDDITTSAFAKRTISILTRPTA